MTIYWHNWVSDVWSLSQLIEEFGGCVANKKSFLYIKNVYMNIYFIWQEKQVLQVLIQIYLLRVTSSILDQLHFKEISVSSVLDILKFNSNKKKDATKQNINANMHPKKVIRLKIK